MASVIKMIFTAAKANLNFNSKSTDLVDGNPAVLADGLLEEEAGEPDQEEHDEIGDEKGAAAILIDRYNREGFESHFVFGVETHNFLTSLKKVPHMTSY